MGAIELAAPVVDDAKQWLERLEQAVGTFLRAQPATGSDEGGARDFAENLVQKSLARLPRWRGSDWAHVTLAITDIGIAIQQAKKDLKEVVGRGYAEGDVWNEMVCALHDFAVSRGYSTSARKDTDKSKKSETAPFVALVKEIQKSFPEGCRRHEHSELGLAEAIYKARSRTKASEA